MKTKILIYLALFTFTVSCDKEEDNNPNTSITSTTSSSTSFGIFSVLNDSTLQLNGVIGSSSLTNFNKAAAAYPNIKNINIVNCDGSEDDGTNLKLSAKVHQKKLNTHINNNGLIASGGVDFFLAGIKRTKGTNTKIGVHSWATQDNTATDFPVGHANHLSYINYYKTIGFTQKNAEEFYYFTINAAPANSIHWMTDAEITQYNIITN